MEDILNFVRNVVQVRNIANSSIKAGSQYMKFLLESLLDENNNFISNTSVHFDKIDDDKSAILISNHPSYLDFAIMKKGINCYCLTDSVDKDLMDTNDYLEKYHIVPYFKDDPNSSSVKDVILKCVSEGKKVLVFPEGSIQTENEMLHFKMGLFDMAYKNNVPIMSFNIIYDKSIENNYLRSILGFFHLPVLSPKIDLYYNETIYPKDHSSLMSFYDKCFESVSLNYYDKIENLK